MSEPTPYALVEITLPGGRVVYNVRHPDGSLVRPANYSLITQAYALRDLLNKAYNLGRSHGQ